MEVSRNGLVKAPGKVLLFGGYLLLKPWNAGLVLSVPPSIYCRVEANNLESLSSIRQQLDRLEESYSVTIAIGFENVQFSPVDEYFFFGLKDNQIEATTDYELFDIFSIKSTGINEKLDCFSFLQLSIYFTLGYVFSKQPQLTKPNNHYCLKIKVNSDKEFYSQLHNDTHHLCVTDVKFPIFKKSVKDLFKTGLGSSAAFVISVIGSLYCYFYSMYLPSWELASDDIGIIHALCQLVHNLSQGKIGSGFDISTGIYGSQIYQRASLPLIETITNRLKYTPLDSFYILIDEFKHNWDGIQRRIDLFPLSKVILAETLLSCGSATTSLVSSLMAWFHKTPNVGSPLWDDWETSNIALLNAWFKLMETYNELICLQNLNIEPYLHMYIENQSCFSQDNNCSLCKKLFDGLDYFKKCFNYYRSIIQKVTFHSNIPVEPVELKPLLDDTLSVAGVLAAGVPGAGGYDVLYCLCVNKATEQKVLNLWKIWNTAHPELTVSFLLSFE